MEIFADQISFAMCCQELALRVEHLPIELNYHTRACGGPGGLFAITGRSDIFPLVLHYHRETDARGYLLPTKIASVNARIRQINRLLRRFDRGDFNPRQQISAQPGQPVLNARWSNAVENASFAPLLIILGPPRSFTTVVSAMLGQHPQIYGLPEVHLFTAETMAEWWRQCAEATFNMDHGLVRVAAQLFFGDQSEDNSRRAAGWLQRRAHFTTGHRVSRRDYEACSRDLSAVALSASRPPSAWPGRVGDEISARA
jgi:hypothetical protein